MDPRAVSDSIAAGSEPTTACPYCGAIARITGGACLGCLLRSALVEDASTETETLDSALASVDIRDNDWRLGNYTILEEIGRGGMGVIYRARQRHSKRIVALKRLLSYHGDSRETLERFRREAEAAASLDHPNILPIYEVGESEGLPFFTMKYATGGSLQQAAPALRANPRECIRLLARVTRAVAYAHREGILHRDLKPGNVLLDGRGEPLVSDFGLAKWIDASSDLTRSLAIFGTPGFIAPEQANGEPDQLTPAADVYSLGAILFDLLAGRPPFLGEHALAVIRQAAEKNAPKLRSLVPTTDRDLETICAKCLERDPRARYRSATELAEDLERWLEGRSIVARPVAPPTRIWRWARRAPTLAGSIAACLVLGAAALIWQFESRHLGSVVEKNQLAARSVTILPFLDLDTVRANTSRASALAQALQAELSGFEPARVASLTDGSAWLAGSGEIREIREANRSLKGRAVLTGSERLVDGKMRLSIRLMDAANGDVLFMQTLETDPDSAVDTALARMIAPDIHSLLNVTDWAGRTLSGQDPGMHNTASREFIVSGRQLMFRGTIEDFNASIRCLERALEIEPTSAIARAYLASTLTARAHFAPDPNLLERAEREAREALRLQQDLPEAHRALAAIAFHRNQFVEALEEQLRAVEAGGPEERVAGFIGWSLMILGQPHRALSWLGMAKHWTTIPGSHDALIGDNWALLENDGNAETAYQRAMDLRPENPSGWIGLCHLRLLQGDIGAARQLLQENQTRLKAYEANFSDNHPNEMLPRIEFFARNFSAAEPLYAELARAKSIGGIASYGGMSSASALGRIRQALGDEAGARAILQKCRERELEVIASSKNPPALYRLAAIEALLGDVEAALGHLRAAIDAGWLDHRSLRMDPRFDALARDSGFQEILSALETKVAGLRRQTGQPFTMAIQGE